MDGRILRVSERVYRVLLVVYPKEFRDAYGPQMVQVFRDSCREESRKGGARVVRLWLHTILDLGTTAILERTRATGLREVGVNKMAGVAAALLKYGLGLGFLFDPLDKALMSDPDRLRVFNLVSPVVFLGGLSLALMLNVHAVLRFNLRREDGAIVSTVRVEMKLANIAVVAVSCLLLGTLVGYFFLENFTYRP
jgi:hypothetical protein